MPRWVLIASIVVGALWAVSCRQILGLDDPVSGNGGTTANGGNGGNAGGAGPTGGGGSGPCRVATSISFGWPALGNGGTGGAGEGEIAEHRGTTVALQQLGSEQRVVLAGTFHDQIEIAGRTTDDPASTLAGFVAAVRRDGNGLTASWVEAARRFGDNVPTALALREDESAVVVGHFEHAMEYAGLPEIRTAGSEPDAFATATHADGSPIFQEHMGFEEAGAGGAGGGPFGEEVAERALAVAAGPGDLFYVAGVFDGGGGKVRLGDSVAQNPSSSANGFILRSQGAQTVSVASMGSQSVTGIVLTTDATELLAVGDAESALVIKNQVATLNNDDEFFLASITSDLADANSVTVFGGTGSDHATGVTIHPDGGVVIIGYANNDITFANDVMFTPLSNNDGFVLKLNAGHEAEWAVPVSGIGDDRVTGVAVDTAGHVIISATVGDGMIKVGDWKPLTARANDILVAELAPDGSVAWARNFGGPQDDEATAIAVLDTDGTRTIAVTGAISSPVDFGLGPVEHTGSTDGFILLIDGPSGCTLEP